MRHPWLRFVFLAGVPVVFSLITPSRCCSKTVWLAWDPNPPEENVVGYRVYKGPVSRFDPAFASYGPEQDVGDVTKCPIEVPDAPVDFFAAVVAYNAYGLQSDYSEEVTISSSTPEGGSASSGGGGGRCFLRTAAGESSGLAEPFIPTEVLLSLAAAFGLVSLLFRHRRLRPGQ